MQLVAADALLCRCSLPPPCACIQPLPPALPARPPCLQDLTAYKKFRNKVVSASARSLISLFR